MKLLFIVLITALLFGILSVNHLKCETQFTIDDLFFGTDSTFEVMTWNLQHFPKNKDTTIEYVSQVIHNLDVDVIGFQEIENASSFISLIEKLNQIDSINVWDGFRANSDEWDMNLAFLYKAGIINVENIYEIYEGDHYAFPRHPLIMELIFNDTKIVIINNHLKAKGGEKNEDRRRDASIKLEKFIVEKFPEREVIIIGDLNDDITEAKKQNVFFNFIEDSDDYLFADMNIAGDKYADWSYPYWPSHIDHIIITNELFDEFKHKDSTIKTITIDKYLEGDWDTYYRNISDHRPVAIKLKFAE